NAESVRQRAQVTSKRGPLKRRTKPLVVVWTDRALSDLDAISQRYIMVQVSFLLRHAVANAPTLLPSSATAVEHPEWPSAKQRNMLVTRSRDSAELPQ